MKSETEAWNEIMRQWNEHLHFSSYKSKTCCANLILVLLCLSKHSPALSDQTLDSIYLFIFPSIKRVSTKFLR